MGNLPQLIASDGRALAGATTTDFKLDLLISTTLVHIAALEDAIGVAPFEGREVPTTKPGAVMEGRNMLRAAVHAGWLERLTASLQPDGTI
jgi:hypothetical protein